SQLLDAMIEAKENKDKLYLICLDELNLAQVEYYFADILSLREQTNVSLELYSKYEYEQNMAEIRWFMQKSVQLQDEKVEEALDTLIKQSMNVSTIDQFRYTQRYNNLKRYNWKLHIPENVRFIGTMNIDGTVRPLSPKVVDRSFIIAMNRQTDDIAVPDEMRTFDLQYGDFSQLPTLIDKADSKVKLKSALSTCLETFEAHFNNRVENHIDDYIAIAQSLNVHEEKILDDIISLKLLPRMEKMIDN